MSPSPMLTISTINLGLGIGKSSKIQKGYLQIISLEAIPLYQMLDNLCLIVRKFIMIFERIILFKLGNLHNIINCLL
jgi:hypothetical protein